MIAAGVAPREVANGSALRSIVGQWPKGLRVYLAAHGLWLALYAFLGKGFAHAGWPPVYVGEFLLVGAISAAVA